jgi:hypothetical protein
MSENWLATVQEAIYETDPQMVEAKIRIAETAIFNRIHDFNTRPDALENKRCLTLWGQSGFSGVREDR